MMSGKSRAGVLGALLGTALVFSACGTKDPNKPDTDPSPTPTGEDVVRYLPMEVGSWWNYQTTKLESGVPGEKTTSVEAFEEVGGAKSGVEAFRVRTVKSSGNETVSWQQDPGSSIIRHREQTFDEFGEMKTDEIFHPEKLRLDETEERIEVGASWSVTYTSEKTDAATGEVTTTSRTDLWTVEAVDESVTVPAGTFSCLRVRRAGSEPGESEKTYWFARGVGKVKEVGGQEELLVEYFVK